LLAGKDINLNLSGDLTNSGTIAGRNVVSLTAQNVNNLGGLVQGSEMELAALQDFNNEGGSISAVNKLTVNAGRDLNVQTTTHSGANAQSSRTVVDRVAGLYVSGANGALVASAGRDLNIVAGVLANAGSGDSKLEAGNNLNLSTVKTGQTHNIVWDANNYRQDSASADVGSTVQGGGNLNLKAGQTVSATAADVQAKAALNVQATNIQLQAGLATQNVDEAHQHTSKGFLSKTTTTTRETSSSVTALGSNFDGSTVNINATDNMVIKGSSVVSDNGTNLTAGGNVSIESAQNSSSSSSYRSETKSGLMGSGGLGVSYGKQKQSLDQQNISSTAAASTVGAINGNVNITAGEQYKQVGSDVLTPTGDINITAKTVDIQEARQSSKQSTEQKFEQSGLTVAVTSTVVSTLQNAQNQIKATTQTSNSRMKALGTASAAANVKMAADALKAGQGDANGMVKTGAKNEDGSLKTNADGTPETAPANAADKAGGIQVALSYGTSSSQSNSSATSDTARGSTVKAGTTTIKATGGGEASNLTIQGSDISGKQVNLEADNKVNLLAAQNTTTQTSDSSNRSASVGIAAQLGNQGAGIGFTGSVSAGKGNGNGHETTYTNTHVAGTDSVSIKSGSDTNVKGATVEGKQVTANVGGNLNVQSLQDTATYAEKTQQIGASGMIGAGGSGSANFAKSSINSNYASVTEQSGLKAGDDGFTVNVQGNTALVGGAITSTQAAIDNNKNSFQTGGTLTTSDIENKASFEAKSVSVSVSAGGSPIPGQGLSAALSGAGMGKDSGSTSSTTTAGISGIAGDTAKRTGDNAQAIGKIFDADKVRQEIQAQTKITQEFSKQASAAIATYSDQQKKDLQAQIRDEKTSKEDKVALKQQLDQVLLEEKVLNILVGAVTGFGQTMVTKESLREASEQMREVMIADSTTFKGVVDSTGKVVLSNASGTSEGINGDGFKLGGTRVDLDKLCGPDNARCTFEKLPDGSIDASKPVQFKGDLQSFLDSPEGQKMAGATGGVQGAEGSLFKGTFMGSTYTAGSWQDKLIESFAGTHDFVGGKLSGLYDDQGNATRGRSAIVSGAQEAWSMSGAIAVSTPFAAAQALPPEVWKAISILIGAAR
jgi:filamentous hemagglutinin